MASQQQQRWGGGRQSHALIESHHEHAALAVDYRRIRDILRSGKGAVADAANTPPPPLKDPNLEFLHRAARARSLHPDVWGSEAHPYDAVPPGMTTLLSSGGSPVKGGATGGEEEDEDVPEPPPVMRRTRFFATIRTTLNVLRDTVTSAVNEYAAPDEDAEDTLVPSSDPEEMAQRAEAKRATLVGGVEGAVEEAMEELGNAVYQVFQYAGAKHIQLERLVNNLQQRDEELGAAVAAEREAADVAMEVEVDKRGEAEAEMLGVRNEWRKMLLMAHARNSTARDLQQEVAHLKRGMKQLLGEMEALEHANTAHLVAHKARTDEMVAEMQRRLHEAETDTERVRGELHNKRYALEEAEGRIGELRNALAVQERSMARQGERLNELGRLEEQLREFMQKQGPKGLNAWHKGLRTLVGSSVHDEEYAQGSHGFAKALVEQLLAERSESAAKWVRSLFPEGLPSSARTGKEGGKEGSKGGEGAGTEGGLPRGAGALPDHVRSAFEKQAERRQHFPEQTTHDAISGIFRKWVETGAEGRARGLGAFVHALFLRKEARLGGAEVQMSWLLKSAAMHEARSPTCHLFNRLVGNSSAPLPPLPAVEACIGAWVTMTSEEGGSPVVETEEGVQYVQPDRVKMAMEGVKSIVESMRRSVCGKARARAREAPPGPGGTRSRTANMLPVSDAAGILLEELQAEYARATEGMLRAAYKQADSSGDGRLTISDVEKWTKGVVGNTAPITDTLVLDVYLKARAISARTSSVPDAISADSLIDVARALGLGIDDAKEAEPRLEEVWEAVRPGLEAQLAAVTGCRGVDTHPPEALLEKVVEAVEGGKPALNDMRMLLAVHNEAVLKALKSMGGSGGDQKKEEKAEKKGKGGKGAKGAAEEGIRWSEIGDSKVRQKVVLMEDSLQQQLSLAAEDGKELQRRLALAEQAAAAPKPTSGRGQGSGGKPIVTPIEHSPAGGASRSGMGENVQDEGGRYQQRLKGHVRKLQQALAALRSEHEGLRTEAAAQRAAIAEAVEAGVQGVVKAVRASEWGTALAAGALASARSGGGGRSSTPGEALTGGASFRDLSGEASGYLASPRVAAPAQPGIPRLGVVPTVGEESSFGRHVEEDLRDFEREVKNLRYESRLDGLEEAVSASMTGRDVRSARRVNLAEGQDVRVDHGQDEEEEEDMLLEEASQEEVVGGGGAAALSEVGEKEEMAAVAALLATAEEDGNHSGRRAGQLLEELSTDGFLASWGNGNGGAGVEAMVWEGMGGSGSGLSAPLRQQRRRVDGGRYRGRSPQGSEAGSEGSDWDRADYERGPRSSRHEAERRATTEDALVAEGVALVATREAGDGGGALMSRMESVQEAAKTVDAEAAALEARVDVVRAANDALTTRGSELEARNERLRVAGKMLEKQAGSVAAKGALLAKERETLRREHERLQANRDKLAIVARKLKGRKFNLRAAEAIYARKWRRLESIAREAAGLQAELLAAGRDAVAVAGLLAERGAAIGMEVAPVVLPPPPPDTYLATARSRPTSAHQLSTSRQPTPSSWRPQSAHPPRPSHFLTSKLPNYDPSKELYRQLGSGVVGRPLSPDNIGNSAHQQQQALQRPTSASSVTSRGNESVTSFAVASPRWVEGGGDVADAPRELHSAMRQAHGLAGRLSGLASAARGFSQDVLGRRMLEDASPRDFLDALSNPAYDDPAVMAALLAEVIQTRLDAAAAGQMDSWAAGRQSSASSNSGVGIDVRIPTSAALRPSSAPAHRFNAAPPLLSAALLSPAEEALLSGAQAATGEDLLALCRSLMDRGRQPSAPRRSSPSSASRRPSSGRVASFSSPGERVNVADPGPPGPVLGGERIPSDDARRASAANFRSKSPPQQARWGSMLAEDRFRHQLQQQQQHQQQRHGRSPPPTDMLHAVARGIGEHQQTANKAPSPPRNRLLSNSLNKPAGVRNSSAAAGASGKSSRASEIPSTAHGRRSVGDVRGSSSSSSSRGKSPMVIRKMTTVGARRSPSPPLR